MGQDESPDAQMISSMQNLNSLSTEQLDEFLDMVLGFLKDNQSDALMQNMGAFVERHSINTSALKSLLRAGLLFFSGALKKSLNSPSMIADLVLFGLDQDKAEGIASTWRDRFVNLSKSMIQQTLMVNQLVDMEWKFGVTSSNSEVHKVGHTFLQLKMVLDKGNGKETVVMELTLPQFYQFLQEMEKAKAHLQYFS
eukprot:JP437002.1.p1 GENE.JP437002.1~~JP437002.1.p1  ORF type:complete len:196 (-),score=50.33 JP437002.1:73-660(-)